MKNDDDAPAGADPYAEWLPLLDGSTGDQIPAPFDPQVPMRRLELGGTYLAYVDAGEGEPVLMVPGWTGTVTDFAPQIASLSESYRVVAVDPIGSGYSDRPSMDYAPEDYRRFTRRFVEKLGVWPSVVVGHSSGAAVAYALAISNPELVRGLVLITPRPPVPARIGLRERTFMLAARRLPAATEWTAGRVAPLTAARAARARTRPLPPADAREIRDQLRRMYRSQGAGRVAARSAIRMAEWSEWSGRLREIEVPVLVIWGTRDRVNHPDNVREITAELPGARVELIEGAGHVPMASHPDEVGRLIGEFAEGVVG